VASVVVDRMRLPEFDRKLLARHSMDPYYLAQGPRQQRKRPFTMFDNASEAVSSAIREVIDANHILFDQGVVDGFGHVSLRHSVRPDHFLFARSMTPALVTAQDVL
jgi:hypothetical protein